MNTREKIALVSGATGFLGGNLTQALLKEGYLVYVLVRSKVNLKKDLNPNSSVIVIEMSGAWFEKISCIEFDEIYHAAAWSGLNHKANDITAILDANILLGLKMLECAARQDGPKPTFVYCLSYWQYADGDNNYRPNSLYAASKQAFHDLVQHYRLNMDMPCVGLVIFDTYSVNDHRDKLLNVIASRVASHKQGDRTVPLELTPGNQEIAFCHIDDVTNALIYAAGWLRTIENPERVYLVRSQETMTLKDSIENVLQGLNLDLEIVKWGAKSYPEGQIMKIISTPILPGWSPERNLAETFLEMVVAYENV